MDVLSVLEETLRVAVEYMKLPEMVARRQADFAEFREHMSSKFPVLWDNYPYLFEKLVKGDDVEMLFLFVSKLRTIEQGKSNIDAVRNELGQMLHDKYVKDNVPKTPTRK